MIIIKRFVLPVGVLLMGLAVAVVMVKAAPAVEKTETVAQIPSVTVIDAISPSAPPALRGSGVLESARTLPMNMEVGGRVLSHRMIAGTRVKRGEALIVLDPTDYKASLAAERLKLRRAELDLALEQSRQRTAQKEWQLLGDGRPEEQASLALREPQLAVALASIESAQTTVDRAEKNLNRTVWRAPFDGMIAAESVEIGQMIQPGAAVGSFVGVDHAWVRLPLTVDSLALIAVPGFNAEQGSAATVRQLMVGDQTQELKAEVLQLAGVLDPQTRLAQVLIQIERPLDQGAVPLLPGAYVEVEIEGVPASEAVEIKRSALIDGEVLWVVNSQNILERREVRVLWADAERVLLSEGVEVGESVVSAPLALAISGMSVRPVYSEVKR